MAFLPVLELSSLDSDIGFAIAGRGGAAGWSVDIAGDVNDDGIDDLIVGAQLAAGSAGESYVVFGRTDFGPDVDVDALDGGDGFVIVGASAADRLGWSVAAAGDVNDDGIDDVIVGARDASLNGGAGAAYVIYGRSTAFDSTFDLFSLQASAGFAILGPTANGDAGRSVAGAGDVNGDGIDDVIVAVPGLGRAYVVFGRDGGHPGAVDLAALGTDGVVLAGAGYAVSGAGDVNGDLVDDLVVGAPAANSGAGRTYVVFGGGGIGGTIDLTALAATRGFVLLGANASDDSGYSVSGAGDVNGDGFADVIVGAPDVDRNGSNSGAAYVVFGRSGGFPASIALTALDGSNGFIIEGVAAGDGAGSAVSGAGDIDHDGIDDIAIGAPLAWPGPGFGAGQSYIIFGQTGAFPAVVEASALTGGDGFVVNGACGSTEDVYGDRSGFAVGGGGDVNGDGIDDVVIGATFSDRGGPDSGAAFVVFGRSTDVTPPDTTILTGPDGLTNQNDFEFDFDSNEPGVGYEAALDGSSFATVADPLTLTDVPDGVHTLAVRAKDAAGNADPEPALRTFTVDTTPPDTTILSGPSGPTNDNTPDFDFGSNEDDVTFEATIAGQAFVPGVPLADGEYTLTAIARDAAQNVDPLPATRSFFVDTEAPNTTILIGPSGTIASNDPGFLFDSPDDDATFEVSLDGSSYVAAPASLTLVDLPDGPHTLLVRARDPADNFDPSPALSTFVVDTEPPAAPAIAGFSEDTGTVGDGITTDRFLSISGTAEPSSLVHVFRDGVEVGTTTAAPGSGAWTYVDATMLSLGTHRYKARVEDAADRLSGFSPDLEVLVADTAATPTSGADVLLGSAGANQIQGGEGADTIAGEAGNDTLKGNNGNDALLGGEGSDRLEGGNGADTARGANGTDTLYGENGNDRLYGDNGNDRLEAGAGLDVADGGAGNDTIYGGVDTDTLVGGIGADQIFGDVGGDWIDLGADGTRDTVFGTIAHLADDTIDGFVDGVPTVPGADMVFVQSMTNAQRAQIDGDILDAQGRLFMPGGTLTFDGHAGAEVDAVLVSGGVQIWLV